MLPEYQAKILIVDDVASNILLLRHMLPKQHQIREASNGTTAMSMILEETFDLVLLDVMMPEIDGFQVLAFIRQHFAPHELPVIMVSALDDVANITRGLEEMANDYITKPVNPHILRSRVKTQLHMKFMSDERNQLVEKLEDANITQTHLMRIASHDLKNPLHNIMMAHELLLESVQGDALAESMLMMANQSAQNMIGIVEEFLELDVLRGDKIDMLIERIPLAAAISEVALTYQQAANDKGIALHVELPEIDVLADSKRLRQVLDNLVSNAIKYSPKHHDVWVKVAVLTNDVVIHVVDQGAGVPIEERDQLFQPFSSISTKPTNGEHSTGLGLWIAKQMVELQGGEIGLDSPPQGGSDFWIRLPLADKKEGCFY